MKIGGIQNLVLIDDFIRDKKGFGLSFGVSEFLFNSPSDKRIIIHSIDITNGKLISGPGIPLNLDFLQDNLVLNLEDILLNRVDAGFDSQGPYGVGTYVLGNSFMTMWGTRILSTDVRSDVWDNTIAFFSQPSLASESFKFQIIARLSDSDLIDKSASFFASELFKSGIKDGIFVLEGETQQDLMETIKSGEIGCLTSASISIVYGLVEEIYPEIIITPMGTE